MLLTPKAFTKTTFVAVVLVFIGIFQTTCWQSSPYKGYAKSNTGLYYKILTIGDGKVKPVDGDFLQLTIIYKTIKDSVFGDTYFYNETGMVILPVNKPSFRGSFEEALSIMNEGDRYSFIVNSDSVFSKFFHASLPSFLKPNNVIKMDVTLQHILNKNAYREELKKYQLIVDKKELNEKNKLKFFLDTCKTPYFRIDSTMYYFPIKKGIGNCPQIGDEVTIHYKGRFLNGVEFESTYKQNTPLKFILGEEYQVIKGIEKGINLMNKGAKTKFIIPSQLAFENTGSSTNIIQPFTTVIYEVEVLDIVKPIKSKDSNYNKKTINL